MIYVADDFIVLSSNVHVIDRHCSNSCDVVVTVFVVFVFASIDTLVVFAVVCILL